MKVSREKAAENRERILREAARLFRERGLSEIGVDALTAAAGLTHGSVYSQFGSKERLIAEAMYHGFASNAARTSDGRSLAEKVSHYLSSEHRDRVGRGCVIAALVCEMSRQTPLVRQTFTEGLRRIVQRIGAGLPKRKKHSPKDDALAYFSTMVGAVVLARAVDDPELSDRILSASRTRLLENL
jgi:TetR/AcrR family transcriptional repressor of nem operon